VGYSLVARLSQALRVPGAPPAALYRLSLHDALPISGVSCSAASGTPASCSSLVTACAMRGVAGAGFATTALPAASAAVIWPVKIDRKSTRLNSSHQIISYAVFCLQKKETR